MTIYINYIICNYITILQFYCIIYNIIVAQRFFLRMYIRLHLIVNVTFSFIFKCIFYVQKIGVCKIFFMFLKEVSYAHQGVIYLIKKSIIFCEKTIKIYNIFYFNIIQFI